MFYLCFRYFTSAQSAKRAKDALTGELEEDLRSSTAAESEATEPQEKVPRVEAAAAPGSFMQEFDQIVEECEDPAAKARALHSNCMDILRRKPSLPQTTHTSTGESSNTDYLVLLPLPQNTSVPPALV